MNSGGASFHAPPPLAARGLTPVDFSLLFLDLLKNFCHPFLPVCSASADGRSSGGAEEPLGRPRDGRRTALLEAVGFAGLWGRRSAAAAGGRSVGSVESRLEKEDLSWLGLLHGLVEQPGLLEGGGAAARGSAVAAGRRRERQRGLPLLLLLPMEAVRPIVLVKENGVG